MSTSMVTGKVRISYEHLLKPYANQPGQEPKFSATLLIPKSDTATRAAIDKAMEAAAVVGVATKWNGTRPQQLRVPIYDGDGLRPNGERFGPECAGHWVMTASSFQLQDVVDVNRQPILSPSEIYSGMYARVHLNFFPYANSGNKGIGCGLGPVQKLADGEPLGGRVSADAAFADAPPVDTQPAAAPYAPPAAYGSYTSQVDPFTGEVVGGAPW